VAPQDYLQEQNSQLRQAIVEQTRAEDLQVDWLFQESNWEVRQILLNKLGQRRILQALSVDCLGLSDELLGHNIGSFPWLIHSIWQNIDHPTVHSAISAIQSLPNATDAEKLDALRKALLLNALERITLWLQENTPAIVSAFLSGLRPEEIIPKLDSLSFKLPQEVHNLYCWHNGTGSEQGLFVYHSFMPLDAALEYSEYLNSEDLVQNRHREGEPMYLFPIFDFEGEYFAVVGSDTVMETAPVYHISDCLDCRLAFNSLSTMMLTIAEAYEAGAYTSNSEVGVEWEDTRLFEEIRSRYNPGTTESLYHYS